MTIPYRIDFDRMEWVSPMTGVRHKWIDRDGRRIRLVEYTKDLPPHWCEKGHCGILLNGRLEIEFPGATVIYHPGDGIVIPDGPEHKHQGRVLSEVALVFFIENA